EIGQCADVVDVVSVEQPVHARGQVGAGEATNHAASNAVVVGRKRAELQRGMDAMEHQQEGLEPAISPPVGGDDVVGRVLAIVAVCLQGGDLIVVAGPQQRRVGDE